MGIVYTPVSTWASTATLAEDAVDDDVAATWNGPIQTALDRTEYLYERRCIARSHDTIGSTSCPGNGTATTLFQDTITAPVDTLIEISTGIMYSWNSVLEDVALRITTNGVSQIVFPNSSGSKLFVVHKHTGIIVGSSLTCTVDVYNVSAAPALTLTVHHAWNEIQVWGGSL